MYQALIVMAISWGVIASGHGLYACALVNLDGLRPAWFYYPSKVRLFSPCSAIRRVKTASHGETKSGRSSGRLR